MGRSGSTLLEMLLSTSPSVYGVGELFDYNHAQSNNGLCSCSQRRADCPVWGDVAKRELKIVNRVNRETYVNILTFLLNPFRKRLRFKNTSEDLEFFQEIRKAAQLEDNTYIVDSSKEVGRLIELSQSTGVDLYNVFLVRDARGVAHSTSKNIKRPGKNYFMAIFRWIVMNGLISASIRKLKIRSIRVSYDRFCLDPATVIKELEAFLGIAIPDDYIQTIQGMDYHSIRGNRLRLAQNRKGIEKISDDEILRKHHRRPIQQTVGRGTVNRFADIFTAPTAPAGALSVNRLSI
jgi:hypothetical protein